MPTLLPPNPGFSDSLGSGFGKGLTQSLDSILQSKMQELESRRFTNAAEKAGIPKDQAEFLQYLSPQERLAFMQRLQPGDFSQQSNPQLDQMFAQVLQGQPQQDHQEVPQPVAQALEKLNPRISPQEQLLRDVATIQQRGQQQAQAQRPAAPLPQQQPQAPLPQQQALQQGAQQRPKTIADVFSRPSPSQQVQERHHQEKIAKEDEKLRYKYILPDIKKQDEIANAKRQEDAALKRVITIREGGKARNAALSQALKTLGIDYEALKNKETLELTKLTNLFLKGGPAIFGGKVSNFEAQRILESVPNYLQNDEAATWLANQLINSNQEDIAKARIMHDVIKDNKNINPLDFQIEVERRLEPLREKFANDFVNGATAFTTKQGAPESSAKLPSAKDFPGAVYEDESTGKRYRSDGTRWVKA